MIALLTAPVVGQFDREPEAVRVAGDPSSRDESKANDGEVSPSVLEGANERLATQLEVGWVPYGGDSAIAGEAAVVGWVHVSEPLDPGPQRRRPIFDEPGGTIVGYHYSTLGSVPLDQVDSFNAPAARTEERGCDPLLDTGCVDADALEEGPG